MLISDLALLHALGAPTIDPDGSRAVVARSSPDLESDSYPSSLWMVPLTGVAEPWRLTNAPSKDSSPRFSPDGHWLAFLRAEPKGKPQVALLPLRGGDAITLTDAPLGAEAPRWSPDGRQLLFTARVPEPGRYGTGLDAAGEKIGPDQEAPRLITGNRYRIDGVGFINDKRQQLWVLDVPVAGAKAAPARQLTEADADSIGGTWSPDGATIAFISARHDTADSDMRDGIWTCAPDGSGLRFVVEPTVSVEQVVFDPDGSRLWFLAGEVGDSGVDFVGRTTGLWSAPIDASARPRRHTDSETVELTGPLTFDASGLHCLRLNRGAVELVRYADGELSSVAGGPCQIQAHDVAPDGTVVFTATDQTSGGELFVVPAGGSEPLRRSDFGASLRSTGRLFDAVEVSAQASDGYPVHGWVMKPAGPGPHPVLLLVHGGPFAQYGWNLFDEFLVAVTAGYAVVFGNPRGSAGYGESHGRSVRRAMGTVDALDVLALLEAALLDLSLDGRRVGVMGGSYGGYMTALLTTRTDRFTAAIVERGFLDPVSFAGSSDIGWSFGWEYVGEHPAAVAAQSPMAAISSVVTPTMVIHSEHDWRCPLEQGQRWYAALRRQGVETELLLFPGEGHELTRSGSPQHRRARFEHVMRWWSEHLPLQGISR